MLAAIRVLDRCKIPGNQRHIWLNQVVQALQNEVASGQSLPSAEDYVFVMLSAARSPKGDKAAAAVAAAASKARGVDDENAVEEAVEAEIFSQYSCASLRDTAFSVRPRSHPGEIAEAGLLASVPPSHTKRDPF